MPSIFRDERTTPPPPHVTLAPDAALASQLEEEERRDFDSVMVVQSSEAWALLSQIRREVVRFIEFSIRASGKGVAVVASGTDL